MAKVEMTEELAEQLKGILPFSLDARKIVKPAFFTENNVPEKFIPSFTLRPMTKTEKIQFSTMESSEFFGRADILFACIDKAENIWELSQRKPIKEFSREIFDALHPAIISELHIALFEISGLTRAEKLGLK